MSSVGGPHLFASHNRVVDCNLRGVPEPVVIVEDGEANVVLSTKRLPLLVATWSGTLTVDLVDRYFAAHYAVLHALQAQGRRCVLITMGLAAGRPSPIVRRRIVERMDDDREIAERVLIANAVVVESAIVRGAMVAMSWVDPTLRVPMFASEAEAFEWARQRCEQAGVRSGT